MGRIIRRGIQVFLIGIFFHASNSVDVTLEGGQQGTVQIEVQKGKERLMLCSYTSVGETQVDWLYSTSATMTQLQHVVLNGLVTERYQDNFVFQPLASLQLKVARKADKGYYKCTATSANDSPSQASATYSLTVTVPPSVPQCQFPSDLALTKGFQQEFKCSSSEGIPAPVYTWYKNKLPLPTSSSSSLTYTNTSFTYDTKTGTLVFAEANAADAGEYYCEASNKLGKAKCSTRKIILKEQNVGMIVGVVFAVIFGLILIAVLVWWTWKKGYCERSKEDELYDGADDGSNDIMLDGNGPTVTKAPSEISSSGKRQEASMMI